MLHDKIREFFKASGTVDGLVNVVEKANEFMLAQTAGDYPPDMIEEIQVLNNKYMALVKGRLDEFTEKFVNLYAEYYTEEDMDALLAFYASPVAKKSREVTEQLLNRSIEISADFNKELLKQLDGATLNRQVN